MPETRLCHLLLGFNTLYKPDLFHCDTSNCSISLLINIKPIQILAYGHTYHKSCYTNNGSKCMHCLSFLQDGIDEHIWSLLERLHRFEGEQQAEVENLENNLPYDNDEKGEPIKYVAYALEEALHKFQQQ